jgi:hypothetical protein
LEEAEKHVSQEDRSVSWIRFRGNSRFRREAKKGDVVVSIWTADGKGKPNVVPPRSHSVAQGRRRP